MAPALLQEIEFWRGVLQSLEGHPSSADPPQPDALLDLPQQFEVAIVSRRQAGICPDVFEAVIALAQHYATSGIEGVKKGHIFVIGDPKRIMQFGPDGRPRYAFIKGGPKGDRFCQGSQSVSVHSDSEILLKELNHDGMTVIDGESGMVVHNNVFSKISSERFPAGGARAAASAGLADAARCVCVMISEDPPVPLGRMRIFLGSDVHYIEADLKDGKVVDIVTHVHGSSTPALSHAPWRSHLPRNLLLVRRRSAPDLSPRIRSEHSLVRRRSDTCAWQQRLSGLALNQEKNPNHSPIGIQNTGSRFAPIANDTIVSAQSLVHHGSDTCELPQQWTPGMGSNQENAQCHLSRGFPDAGSGPFLDANSRVVSAQLLVPHGSDTCEWQQQRTAGDDCNKENIPCHPPSGCHDANRRFVTDANGRTNPGQFPVRRKSDPGVLRQHQTASVGSNTDNSACRFPGGRQNAGRRFGADINGRTT